MLNEMISHLVTRLGINSGGHGYWADDPAYKAVLGALIGESETAVTVVDVAYQGDRYLVLGAIDADRLPRQPLLIRAHLHKNADPGTNWGCACKGTLPRLQNLRWLGREDKLTTEDVAGFFAGRCNGLGEDTSEFPKTWAPSAVESFAPITIAGDLTECVQTTDDTEWDSNHYEWFDLKDVPVGGSVYRLSATNTLWLFTKREATRWEVTIVPSVSWATTSHHDGSKDFGMLLDGALEAYRMAQRITA